MMIEWHALRADTLSPDSMFPSHAKACRSHEIQCKLPAPGTTVAPIAVVVHGGAGAAPQNADGCRTAAGAALAVLADGGEALDAVVRAVMALEVDGRCNAGSGAVVAPDGMAIEMHAAIIDTCGRLNAVACVRDVRHPVLLAREVARTSHRFIAGRVRSAWPPCAAWNVRPP